MKFLSLRIRFPLFSDALTCRCIANQFLSTSRSYSSPNENYEINPDFTNRNPRNLEEMGLARKRLGWKFQRPNKEYYNKLVLEKTRRNTEGKVVHWTGKTVVSASTQEWAIKRHLYSCHDVSAAQNIGSVLAERCLQAGITNVFFDKNDIPMTESVEVFLKAIEDGCVKLEEPEVIKPHYRPGIDYDDPKRLGGEDKDQPMKDDYQF